MKKTIILFLAALSFFTCEAQKILDKNKATIGYITHEGMVLDDERNTIGYLKADGTVLSAKYTTIGYIKPNGMVTTPYGEPLGYIQNDIIYNNIKSIIGYIGQGGKLLDPNGQLLVTLVDIKEDIGAACIFFFFSLTDES